MLYRNFIKKNEISIGNIETCSACTIQVDCDCDELDEYQGFPVLEYSVYRINEHEYLKLKLNLECEHAWVRGGSDFLIHFNQIDELIEILTEAKKHGK